MKLPYGDKAIIEQRKIMDYSLSPDHDDGKHKARLFRDLLGLTRDHATLLLDALKEAAVDGEAVTRLPLGNRTKRWLLVSHSFRRNARMLLPSVTIGVRPNIGWESCASCSR